MFDPDWWDRSPQDGDPLKMIKGVAIYIVVGVAVWTLLHW